MAQKNRGITRDSAYVTRRAVNFTSNRWHGSRRPLTTGYRRHPVPLFEEERRKAFMINAMDTVNDRFGNFTVTYGSLLGNNEEKGSHVISPAWKPEGIRNVQVR